MSNQYFVMSEKFPLSSFDNLEDAQKHVNDLNEEQRGDYWILTLNGFENIYKEVEKRIDKTHKGPCITHTVMSVWICGFTGEI